MIGFSSPTLGNLPARRGSVKGWRSQKTSRALPLRQQRLDFAAQGLIPGAGLGEKLRALARVALPRGVVQAFDFQPALTLHSVSPCSGGTGTPTCAQNVTQAGEGVKKLNCDVAP